MKVFVAGLGILGSQIAHALTDTGNDVTAMEIDPGRADRARRALGCRVVEGDCSDPAILERGELTGTDAFLALTGSDEANLVASQLAKSQFDIPRVVARINDPRNSWLFDDTWGVDVAMSAPAILVSLVEEATSATPTVSLMDLATARVRVIETSIGPASPFCGRPLREIAVPAGVMIATVIRQGRPLPPEPEAVLDAGDQVLLVAERGAEVTVEQIFSTR